MVALLLAVIVFLRLIIISVTRRCYTRYTNVPHALHIRVTIVAPNFDVEFTIEIQYI